MPSLLSLCHQESRKIFSFKKSIDAQRWIFTGGQDGFIRKYDFVASMRGLHHLTNAQRHSIIDSVSYVSRDYSFVRLNFRLVQLSLLGIMKIFVRSAPVSFTKMISRATACTKRSPWYKGNRKDLTCLQYGRSFRGRVACRWNRGKLIYHNAY